MARKSGRRGFLRANQDLRQYEHIVSSSSDMMALLNDKFAYLSANAAYLAPFRKTPDELIGHSARDVFGEEFFERTIEPHAQRCLSGETVTYQKWFDFPAYEPRYMEVVYYPYIDANHEVKGIVVSGRDATARKQAEEALRESRERYWELYDSSPISLWEEDFSDVACYLQQLKESGVTDLGAHLAQDAECAGRCAAMVRILEVNEATLRMYEAETSRELFSNLSRVFIEESVQGFQKQLMAIWAGEIDVECETVNQTLKGQRKDLLLRWRVASGHEKTYAKVVVSILDITERKQAEKAQQESERRFRFLIEKSPLGTALISAEGKYLYLSPAFEEMFGYTLEDIPTGRLWFGKAFPDPKDREEAISQWVDGLKGHESGEVWPRVFEVTCRDGSVKTIHFKPVVMEDGQQLVIYEDITQQERMEEEIRRAHNLESLGFLAGGIAHDFNNVLTGVTGNLELLVRFLDKDSTEHEIAQDAQQAASRTRDLTQQLMTFAKGGAPVKEIVCIRELIRNTTDLSLRGANTRPEFHFSDELSSADVDAGQIAQVIQNLVLNADQAMPNGGTLRIVAGDVEVSIDDLLPLKAGTYVKVSVEDQGVGIPENILSQVFDPYFSTKETGHGLGLSICHSVVQRHDGHITVSSEQGKGTTFQFYLPASKEQAMTTVEQEKEISVGTGKILYMDDEEVIHRTVGRTLKLLGYDVERAFDGGEAIGKYKDALGSGTPFDIVIMDLTIPGGMGGKEAIGKLLEIDPQARVLVSSGYSHDPIMANHAQYGFVGSVTKPVSVEKLADTVKKILKKGE
jgi:PAS domain S-box-containing protein